MHWKTILKENKLNSEQEIRMESVVVRDNNIIFSEMDGETVMMSVEKGEYYGVNPIGSRIWALLETPKKVSELCAALLPDYDVTAEQCSRDVMVFLSEMTEKGVIKVAVD
jgi:hypothetical protein